jgi:hypothetical protein
VTYYDPDDTSKLETKTVTYTEKVIGTPTADEVKNIAIQNVPSNLDNNYFDYSLNTANITVNGSNVTVDLTQKAHTYVTYIISDTKTIRYERTYQHYIDVTSSDFGFKKNTDVIWYETDATGELGSVLNTGANYRFRAIVDNLYIKVVENKDQVTMNGKSVVVSSGNTITTINGVDKLNQNFYIADYLNANTIGKDNVQFLGAGVVYYSVKGETGVPKNDTVVSAGLVDSNGVGQTDTIEQFLRNRLGDFTTSVPVTTDSTKLGYRYLTDADDKNVFRYSDALEAYQYIFTLTFTNKYNNSEFNARLYSFFVYSYTDSNGETQYNVSISDNYAEASMYVS